MSGIMIFNGEEVREGEVSLGFDSRALAYGMGVFETLTVRAGRACFLGKHIDRLQRAVAAVGLKNVATAEDCCSQVERLIALNNLADGVVKLIVADDGGRASLLVFVRTRGLPDGVPEIAAYVSEVSKASKAFTSRYKTLNYFEPIRELEQAKASGYGECLFFNEFGYLAEGAISNVFFSKFGSLHTPRLSCGVLDGIVRGELIAAAVELGIEVEEGDYTAEELMGADAVFVSNSVLGICPVTRIARKDESESRFPLFARLSDLRSALAKREATQS